MLPWRNGPKCELDHFYREKGFYPALKPEEKETVKEVHGFEKRQSVAITLAHSYDDWVVSVAVDANGKAHAAWCDDRTDNAEIWYTSYQGGGLP